MSYETVDFKIVDTTPSKMPIQGVVVKLLSADGTAVKAQGVTDANGLVFFLLPTASYQARFYKQQVVFTNPVVFDVLAAPESNVFTVQGQLFAPPTTSDIRLCVAYGYFRTTTGAPASGVDIHFLAKFKPLLLEGSGVLTGLQVVRTDEKGYLQVPLIRHGQYDVLVQGMEDVTRLITVPDAVNVNLPSLLFPVPSQVTYTPAGPYTLAVGSELTLTPTVFTSDGNCLEGTGLADIAWGSSDSNVLAVLPSSTTITLRGISPGVATVHLARLDPSIVVYPDPGIAGNDVQITVI